MEKLYPKSLQSAAEIIVGKVGAARGLDGTLKIIPLTDFEGRFDALEKIFVGGKILFKNTALDIRFFKIKTTPFSASNFVGITEQIFPVSLAFPSPKSYNEKNFKKYRRLKFFCFGRASSISPIQKCRKEDYYAIPVQQASVHYRHHPA